jgi:glyoxalase family protein
MALEGLHHITAITGDAPANVDFYGRVMGLRLVKKTVNFDAPDVYHLYFGDEAGTPGSILTFFEFPGARRGRPGAGMVHRLLWRVASADALDFWAGRLAHEHIESRRAGDRVQFADPEGLDHELVVFEGPDAPLVARSPDVPEAVAVRGFHGVRAYAAAPERSLGLLEALGFQDRGEQACELAGEQRRGIYAYDAPPRDAGVQGAGSVHHIAWSAADDDELRAFRERAIEHGARATDIIDRQYFHSVYFREPSGVLFELATRDIGFDVDEPAEHLGESLRLPPQHEHLRAQLEQVLTPLRNLRAPAPA